MKKILFFLFLFLIVIGCNYLMAQNQPQWKFPIAFEDATGAKDTVFFVWDSTATMQLDSALGEYPVNLMHGVFQVYWAYNSDTTKVYAIPISNPFFNNAVVAKNYVYPIKISWDTSLFRSTSLPSPVNCAEMSNEYFFDPWTMCQNFNMLLTDSVMAPYFNWGSHEQFPINIALNRVAYCCVNGVEENSKNSFFISPNPFSTTTQITLSKTYHTISLSVYDMQGKLVAQNQYADCDKIQLNRKGLTNGMYFLKLIMDDKEITTGKIVVSD